MNLIIQIPCFNEEDQIAQTIAELPKTIDGITSIHVLVIDDGSQDRTVEKAIQAGAHYIKRVIHNRGLANAYSIGLDACYRLGADIVINTDADNQYCAADIKKLVTPIINGEADLVIGDRETDSIESFSPLKKYLQKLGTSIVNRASGMFVADSTSGFRAISRKAMSGSFIHNRFSYTLESIIHAGNRGLKIANIKINTNPMTRPSRLAKNSGQYVKKNGLVIFRAYAMYWPIQTFGLIASMCLFIGSALIARFIYYYLQAPDISSHIQSLQLGVGFTVIAFIIYLLAILSDLIAANRRITEEILTKCRHIETHLEQLSDTNTNTVDVIKTEHAPWMG